MAARDLSELTLLTATALEGPTGQEATDAATQLAEVIALGASLDVDPAARQGVELLWQRIRAQFVLPALSTDSTEAFHALWAEVAWTMLRHVDAMVVLLGDGAAAMQSELMSRRLDHGDKVAIAKLARKLSDAGFPELADKLRRTSLLISDARERLREIADDLDESDTPLIKGFHRGVLLWVLGIGLCVEAADRVSGLVDEALRTGLIADVVDFAADGARLAGYLAALTAGLDVDMRDSNLELVLSSFDAVAFLLRTTREIPRVFGPEVAYKLEYFRYPDAPDEYQYHVIIDSPAPPAEASEQLDALCDSWWDAAVAELGVDLFPVLGVIDDG